MSNLQVAATGFPLGGSISFEFTEDSAVPDIRRVRVFYDGSNLARVEVTFTNGSSNTTVRAPVPELPLAGTVSPGLDDGVVAD